jgi:hypothetical protein
MKISKSSLHRIIKEEISKKLSEVYGDLSKPYDIETLRKAGLVGPSGKPRPRPEKSPFLDPSEVSAEAIRIAQQLQSGEGLEFIEDFRNNPEAKSKLPAFVQAVIDKVVGLAKSGGIDLAE